MHTGHYRIRHGPLGKESFMTVQQAAIAAISDKAAQPSGKYSVEDACFKIAEIADKEDICHEQLISLVAGEDNRNQYTRTAKGACPGGRFRQEAEFLTNRGKIVPIWRFRQSGRGYSDIVRRRRCYEDCTALFLR